MVAALLAVALAAPPAPPAGGSGLPDDVRWAAVAACPRMAAGDSGGPAAAVCVGFRDGFAYLLTADHLAPKGDPREFQFFDRESGSKPVRTAVGGEVLARLTDPGVALLRVSVSGDPVSVARLAGRGHRPKRYPFTAAGVEYTTDGPPTCRAERIAGKVLGRRTGDGGPAFFWDAGTVGEALPGSPLLDPDGRVIGVRVADRDGRGRFAHLDELLVGLKRAGYGWLTD